MREEEISPAQTSSITDSSAGDSGEASAISAERTANPSSGDLSKEGWSKSAETSSAAIRPQAFSMGIISVSVTAAVFCFVMIQASWRVTSLRSLFFIPYVPLVTLTIDTLFKHQ